MKEVAGAPIYQTVGLDSWRTDNPNDASHVCNHKALFIESLKVRFSTCAVETMRTTSATNTLNAMMLTLFELLFSPKTLLGIHC